MKVLITGGGGQIGHALSASAPDDLTVATLSRRELNVADEHAVGSWLEAHRPDVVINAAAYTAVDRAEDEPEIAAQVNAQGPRYLAEAARRRGARLIHLSTDFVFDGTSSVPYRPEASTAPLSVYGMTKRAGEQAVLDVLPTRSTIVRTAWVYAAQGRNFLRTMLRLMTLNGRVRVVADQVGSPTSAHSVARALWWIVARPELVGIHHWTDSGVASWYDFGVAIAEEGLAAGLLAAEVDVVPISTAQYPTRARRPSYSVLDRSSLLDALGIVPAHWRKNLREVIHEIGHA
ncbi:MAG TPA: dTDP-4-dehydrorhamnose reductase [Steroidobacteraceae bacterium]|nr:dTDP-4-dehydrorhamnose reductase [Steroidobacteraceae bacterium]